MKYIHNLVNNQDFIVQDPDKFEPVNPCMNVYKEKFNMIEVLTS